MPQAWNAGLALHRNKSSGCPPALLEERGRWPGRLGLGGGRGLGAGEGADDETNNFEIRKTNLECALESTVSLFGVSLHHCTLGARAGQSVRGGKPIGAWAS